MRLVVYMHLQVMPKRLKVLMCSCIWCFCISLGYRKGEIILSDQTINDTISIKKSVKIVY